MLERCGISWRVKSELRPSRTVMIDDEVYDSLSVDGFILLGARVKILKKEGIFVLRTGNHSRHHFGETLFISFAVILCGARSLMNSLKSILNSVKSYSNFPMGFFAPTHLSGLKGSSVRGFCE